MHVVISALILGFMIGLIWMAYELTKISDEHDSPLPDHVEHPWIPGTKLVAGGAAGLARGAKHAAQRCTALPGAGRVVSGTHAVLERAKSAPGAKLVQQGVENVKAGAQTVHRAGLRFEHGRELVEEDRPGVGTLLFTVLALLAALFMLFGPFDSVFFP